MEGIFFFEMKWKWWWWWVRWSYDVFFYHYRATVLVVPYRIQWVRCTSCFLSTCLDLRHWGTSRWTFVNDGYCFLSARADLSFFPSLSVSLLRPLLLRTRFRCARGIASMAVWICGRLNRRTQLFHIPKFLVVYPFHAWSRELFLYCNWLLSLMRSRVWLIGRAQDVSAPRTAQGAIQGDATSTDQWAESIRV